MVRTLLSSSEAGMMTDRLVVVVDDEPDLRSLICEVLEEEGYSVVSLPHPSLALGLEQMPSLFLIDLMLPGMTGIELAQKLRQGPYGETGMIGLSASSAMLRHANDSRLFQETIQKPFDLEYLLEAVRQHVA
jgi:CheY-like chemotaxis protein